ncbi:hypothetical protein [Enterococcus faecium]|nr:hypothetical protein [Enterococcus faecium]
MHVDLFFRRLQRRGQKFAANHFSSIQIIVFYYADCKIKLDK